MTDERFAALIAKHEERARRDPGGYKARVMLLALLGYAYLGAVVLLVVALLAGLIASIAYRRFIGLKLILPVVAFLAMVLRALWVKIEPPEGIEITPRQAPQLFATLDALSRRLGAPRFHHVLIDSAFNAAVVQAPRLGMLGWQRNYLLLGLPLLQSVSAEQLEAVLAHELGHLAKGHGRLGRWIYRQRRQWHRLMTALNAEKSGGSFLFAPFFHRFAPYFDACSFPLARANEYEADATSARLTSPRTAAEALTGIQVVAAFLDGRYWPQVYGRVREAPQPSVTPYASLGAAVDELFAPGCALLRDYAWRHGRDDQAEGWRQRLRERARAN